jgi:hypothetical protein
MAIKIQHRRQLIECSTVEEFRGVIQTLNDEEERLRQQGRTPLHHLASLLAGGGHWDGQLFVRFIDALGGAQVRLLSLLVRRGSLTDQEMRTELALEDNKQLAGVLSGISKQAAALNIPARDVFTINKEFQAREFTKSYTVAVDFLRIATEMNWPTEEARD